MEENDAGDLRYMEGKEKRREEASKTKEIYTTIIHNLP